MKYGIGNPRPLFPGMGTAVARRTVFRKKNLDGSYQNEQNIKNNDPYQWENWDEVAKRVAEGNIQVVQSKTSKSQRILPEQKQLQNHIANGSILMSGRHLQHGDSTMKEKVLELWSNCSTASSSFMLFYLLLNGSGVGRCYDDDMMIVDWSRQPYVRVALNETHPDFDHTSMESLKQIQHCYGKEGLIVYTVQDSREGWAKALEFLEVYTWRKGAENKIIVFDFSRVRARGELIGGMQLRPSSGPVPTMIMFNNIAKLKGCHLAKWQQAMYVDHYAAESVLVGGARRAARIAIKYWRDPDIMDFIRLKQPWTIPDSHDKNGNLIRKGRKTVPLWSANNSIGVDEDFWNEINSIKNQNKDSWANKVFGAICDAAYNHGSGEPGIINLHKLQSKSDSNAFTCANISSKRYNLDHAGLMCKRLDQIASTKQWMMIVNPCLDPKHSYFKTHGGTKLMSTLSVGEEVWTGTKWSKITKIGPTGYKDVFRYFFGDKSLDCTEDHLIQTTVMNRCIKIQIKELYSHRLSTRFQDKFGKELKIIDKMYRGKVEVWDFTVEDDEHVAEVNGLIVSNCGEIALNINGGYCVIADVVPFHCDSIEECIEAVRLATRALIRTNLLDCVYGPETKRTNRIGVGLTGIHEFMWKFFNITFTDIVEYIKEPTPKRDDKSHGCQQLLQTLKHLSQTVREESIKYSEELGVNIPHTCVTIKPSGTVSKLFGLTEGAHLPSMREYIRWCQFRSDDPLVSQYSAAGYRTKKLKTYSGTTVVGFPTKPIICDLNIPNLIIAPEATMEDQFRWLQILEKYWLNVSEDWGNQVSYTLKYDRNQVSFDTYKQMIQEYMPTVRCCSVMPTDCEEHEYLPEQSVSKEEYDNYVKSITKLEEDIDEENLKCASGACPL